jgi:hypothetical protein
MLGSNAAADGIGGSNNFDFQLEIAPADGIRCIFRKRRLRYVAVFFLAALG